MNLLQLVFLQMQRHHKNFEISYARSIDPGRFYPRFHAYLELTGSETKLNLHLDMKKPSYGGNAAHSGEYEGELVENEAQRIKSLTEKFIASKNLLPQLGFKPKTSLLNKILIFFKIKKLP